jgi:Icc-related predicted phosphoesterase
MYFVHGNHEEYELLDKMDIPNIHYLRGGLHVIDSIRIGALGGIYYLGKNEQKARMKKYTQRNEYWRVLKESVDGIDILLTHDSPKGALPHLIRYNHGSPYVSTLTRKLKPEILIHGHYHYPTEIYKYYQTKVIYIGYRDTYLLNYEIKPAERKTTNDPDKN